MLHGRYLVAKMSDDLAPPEMFLRSVWTTDPRPRWMAHKDPKQSKPYRALLKLVATIERRAKEDR